MATRRTDTASNYDLEFDSADDALLCELVDAISTQNPPPHHQPPPAAATNPLPSAQCRHRDGLEMDLTSSRAPSAPSAPSAPGAALQGVAHLSSAAVESLAGPLTPPPGHNHNLNRSLATTSPTETGDTSSVRELEKQLEEKALAALAALPGADTLNLDSVPPLTRFRSFPHKSLTVTDLTSGAWCELQHFYTLSRLPGGRKTRTKAMAQGTRVHKVLEDQVHETVAVEVLSREDAVGVRVWNLIQSLQTLAETGLTREMQVWGIIGGQVVSGIIDGVGWQNPDAAKEDASSPDEPNAQRGRIDQYLWSPQTTHQRLVYLTDVKTRGSASIPAPAAIWPAMIQLYLYHRFLEDMVTDKLNLLKVFRRYGADPDEPFSDTFLAQMAGMHEEMFGSPPNTPDTPDTPVSSQHPPVPPANESAQESTLAEQASSDPAHAPPSSPEATLKYRTLRNLASLLKPCIAAAFPQGTASIADRLCVEYRHRGDGGIIARKTFDYEAQKLDDFVTADLEWWRGERPPRGVKVEDTFKCHTCDFADDCQWREDMALKKLREVREKLLRKRKESDDKMESLGW